MYTQFDTTISFTGKRVANGVCPVCNRSFGELAAHMKTKHPRYSHVHEPPQESSA